MITKLQRKALLFIEAEMERSGGVAPSVRELADYLRYRSPSPARRLLIGLEERGFIRRLPDKDRAIEVIKPVSRFAAYRFDPERKALQRSRSDPRRRREEPGRMADDREAEIREIRLKIENLLVAANYSVLPQAATVAYLKELGLTNELYGQR